jgi:hypothetical protein
MTYTKAPWHICEVTGRGLKLIRDANGYCVAEAVKPANSGAAYIDADANAALIAAAPEMLAALERAYETFSLWLDIEGWDNSDETAMAQMWAAIAKAKGEVA